MKSKKIIRVFLFTILFAMMVASHFFHEKYVNRDIKTDRAIPAEIVKMFDLGLHSAIASFLWVEARTHLPFLKEGFPAFWNDVNRVITFDPKFSAPYVQALLLLPQTDAEDSVKASVALGKYGVDHSDDWRVPFYLAAVFHIYEDEKIEAAKYFDIASRGDNIPETVRQYAINYSLLPTVVDQGLEIWQTLSKVAEDGDARKRAFMHIEHIEAANILRTAVNEYFNIHNEYPESIEDLLVSDIISHLPKSPFGVTWKIYQEGVIGVDHSLE